ncbi:MAG TPA: FAD/NAD(P)-binding protein [Desulfosporosinus sp.]
MGDDHVCTYDKNPLIPQVCKIIFIEQETPDVKTFRFQTLDGKKPFAPLPGQLGMLSLLGTGEAMFSITSQGEDYIEISIKRCGLLTEALHEAEVGQLVGLRGPYGNHFPLKEAEGLDLLFVGGGIALAPLRPFINYVKANREKFKHVDILYGSRSPEDLVFKRELFEAWPTMPDTNMHVTVDKGAAGYEGNVGFVPTYMEELAFSPEGKMVVLCGPPIMIKFCLQALFRMGFSKEQVITTLEMRMKCGIGKCGRCNIGSKYVCVDGPVFSMAEIDELPDEK